MKRSLAFLLLLLPTLLITAAVPSAKQRVTATLVANGDTGATGFVELVQAADGATAVHVDANGLKPGAIYTAYYGKSRNCDEPQTRIGDFTATPSGRGEVQARIPLNLDDLGSIAIRAGKASGALIACATIH